jgi:hypothetical protein
MTTNLKGHSEIRMFHDTESDLLYNNIDID